MTFKPGTLREIAGQKAEHAERLGALLTIPTQYEFIEDVGIRFLVRILESRDRKAEARKEQQRQSSLSGKLINPFLPYDENMFVSEISDTHIALLNKFKVLTPHLLIVTSTMCKQQLMPNIILSSHMR